MKFEESFDAVYDKMKKESRKEGKDFVVSPQTAKMLTFFWNMLILSKNKLDDEFVFIDNDYNIVSMPLKEIEEKTIIPGPEDDTNAEPEENEGKKPQEIKAAKEEPKTEEAANDEEPAESNENTENKEIE